MVKASVIVANILTIFRKKPAYKIGHDGSDGQCDCIGMLKGAERMAGMKPVGLSDTNYAARYTFHLEPINKATLKVGYAVFKSHGPDEVLKYNLPDRYRPGGKDYNGDVLDYSHIGYVTSLDPFTITHMTSPTAKQDHKIGQWKWQAPIPNIQYNKEGEPMQARVVAPSGATVNMRKSPGGALSVRVPVGSTVEILEPGTWSYILYNGKKGYMKEEYLEPDTTPGLYSVTVSGLSKIEADAIKAQYPQAEITAG